MVILKLYMYFILSDYFQKLLLDNCTGTTAKGIKADKLKYFLVPLMPLEEQLAFRTALDELMPKIAELEAIEDEFEALKRKFPGDMREAILRAAVQGKLIQQLEDDGAMEDLLQEIQQEKGSLILAGRIKQEKFYCQLGKMKYRLRFRVIGDGQIGKHNISYFRS